MVGNKAACKRFPCVRHHAWRFTLIHSFVRCWEAEMHKINSLGILALPGLGKMIYDKQSSTRHKEGMLQAIKQLKTTSWVLPFPEVICLWRHEEATNSWKRRLTGEFQPQHSIQKRKVQPEFLRATVRKSLGHRSWVTKQRLGVTSWKSLRK